ncbi:MAG: dephospho-CoA kinase [Gemmatimonadetes bacterium]|nr:MAG: dephospho-CoA kinase [Gemmatimonadota bacterium]
MNALSRIKMIGLTGGIASGQTTVAQLLAAKGAQVIHGDVIARQVVEPGSVVLDQLVQAFGARILTADNRLDRSYLGQLVFADPALKRKLDQLIRPALRAELCNQIQIARWRACGSQTPVVVVDAALIFEWHSRQFFDRIVVVYTTDEVRLNRLMARDQLSQPAALQRISAQLPLSVKADLADDVIDNSNGLELTQQQVDYFWRRL